MSGGKSDEDPNVVFFPTSGTSGQGGGCADATTGN